MPVEDIIAFDEDPLQVEAKIINMMKKGVCIIGASKFIKTNLLHCMIDKCQNFDKIYLYAKGCNEPLDEDIINQRQVIYSNNIDDIISIDELDNDKQNLLIFDNLLCEEDFKCVMKPFIRGCKKNVSLVFISPAYHIIPKDIKRLCDYLILTQINTMEEALEIAEDHTTNINKFMKIYRETKRDPFGVVIINRETQQPNLRYEIW